MSTPPIDNLLQVTALPRQATESTRPISLDSAPFQEHLQRASGVNEPHEKPAPQQNSSKIDNDDLKKQDLEQDAKTEQQGEPEPAVEQAEENEVSDVDQTVEQDQDDVTLSEEAVVVLGCATGDRRNSYK